VAHVASTERVNVDALMYQDDGISQVTATWLLRQGECSHTFAGGHRRGLESREDDVDNARYFVSIPELRVTDAAGLARWRKHLFVGMTRLTSDPAEFFDLPLDKTIVMGAEVDI
jgi:KUP system potassium uptake protein